MNIEEIAQRSLQSCLTPVRVVKNGKVSYHQCRKCKACIANLCTTRSKQVAQEIKDNDISLFFTLTYDNAYLPVMRKVGTGLNDTLFEPFRLVNEYKHNNSRPIDLHIDMPCVAIPNNSEYKIPSNYPFKDCFAFLYGDDITKFIKRVYTNYYRLCEKKFPSINPFDYEIRYYICSEYGPHTTRPHYHGLFFCRAIKGMSKFPLQLLTCLKAAISESWRFHNPFRFKFSAVSDPKCSSYVSSYTTSLLVNDSFLSSKPFRPKTYHSINPNIGALQFGDKEIVKKIWREKTPSEVEYEKTNGITLSPLEYLEYDIVKKTYTVNVLPLSAINRLFPRCSDYHDKSFNAKLRCYSVYGNIYDAFQKYVVEKSPFARTFNASFKDAINVVNDFCKAYNININATTRPNDLYVNKIAFTSNRKPIPKTTRHRINDGLEYNTSCDISANRAFLRCHVKFGWTIQEYLTRLDEVQYHLQQYYLKKQYRFLQDSKIEPFEQLKFYSNLYDLLPKHIAKPQANGCRWNSITYRNLNLILGRFGVTSLEPFYHCDGSLDNSALFNFSHWNSKIYRIRYKQALNTLNKLHSKKLHKHPNIDA